MNSWENTAKSLHEGRVGICELLAKLGCWKNDQSLHCTASEFHLKHGCLVCSSKSIFLFKLHAFKNSDFYLFKTFMLWCMLSFGISGLAIPHAGVLIFRGVGRGREGAFSCIAPVWCQNPVQSLGSPHSETRIPCHVPSHQVMLFIN